MYLKAQQDDKRAKVEASFKKEQDAATKAQALIDQQDKDFYSYAEKCIKEWKDNGKNVKPLILELKGKKPHVV